MLEGKEASGSNFQETETNELRVRNSTKRLMDNLGVLATVYQPIDEKDYGTYEKLRGKFEKLFKARGKYTDTEKKIIDEMDEIISQDPDLNEEWG